MERVVKGIDMEFKINFSTITFDRVSFKIGNQNIDKDAKEEKLAQYTYSEPKSSMPEILNVDFVQDQQEYIVPNTTA